MAGYYNWLANDSFFTADRDTEFDPTNKGLPITMACWAKWPVDHHQGWSVLMSLNDGNDGFSDLQVVTNSGDNTHHAFLQDSTSTDFASNTLTRDTGTDWFFIAGVFKQDPTAANPYYVMIRQNSSTSIGQKTTGITGTWGAGHKSITLGARSSELSQSNIVLCHYMIWNAELSQTTLEKIGDGAHPFRVAKENMLYYYPVDKRNALQDILGNGPPFRVNRNAPSRHADWWSDTDGPPIEKLEPSKFISIPSGQAYSFRVTSKNSLDINDSKNSFGPNAGTGWYSPKLSYFNSGVLINFKELGTTSNDLRFPVIYKTNTSTHICKIGYNGNLYTYIQLDDTNNYTLTINPAGGLKLNQWYFIQHQKQGTTYEAFCYELNGDTLTEVATNSAVVSSTANLDADSGRFSFALNHVGGDVDYQIGRFYYANDSHTSLTLAESQAFITGKQNYMETSGGTIWPILDLRFDQFTKDTFSNHWRLYPNVRIHPSKRVSGVWFEAGPAIREENPFYPSPINYTDIEKNRKKVIVLPKRNHKTATFKLPQYSRSQGYTSGPRRYDGKYKPVVPSINKGHPLAKGLIWAFCPVIREGSTNNITRGFLNLVTNEQRTGGKIWSWLLEGGTELSCYLDNPSTANDYLYWRLPEAWLYGSGQTTTAVWVWTGTNQNENWLYDTEIMGNSDYLDAMSVGGILTNPAPIKLYWQDAAGTERTFSTSVFDAQEGPRHCIASRIKSGAYADIWADGIQQGIDTTGYTLRTTNPSGGGRITIGMDGQRTAAKAMQNGIYHLGYKWNRALTDKEMEMIYEQPYLLVSPPQRAFLPDSSKSFTKFTRIRRGM